MDSLSQEEDVMMFVVNALGWNRKKIMKNLSTKNNTQKNGGGGWNEAKNPPKSLVCIETAEK